MAKLDAKAQDLREHRNSRLYRSAARLLREYNRRLVAALVERGFDDFSPAFPPMLSNLDTEGTRIGVLATRAGITRQAAGQLLADIERCGYAERRRDADDARATIVVHTARGRKLLATVLELIEQIDEELATAVGTKRFEQTRVAMFDIANAIDAHGGTLGQGDTE